MALAARAAASLAEATPHKREELLPRLLELHARMAVDPFGATIVPAARTACGAQWTAELARLTGTQTVEHWVAAAGEWDKLARLHDAAYCRWRGAQVAMATGQATLATRLLRRAARDGREHVPLLAAIKATAER